MCGTKCAKKPITLNDAIISNVKSIQKFLYRNDNQKHIIFQALNKVFLLYLPNPSQNNCPYRNLAQLIKKPTTTPKFLQCRERP